MLYIIYHSLIVEVEEETTDSDYSHPLDGEQEVRIKKPL